MIITIATADFSPKPCNNYCCLDFMHIPKVQNRANKSKGNKGNGICCPFLLYPEK